MTEHVFTAVFPFGGFGLGARGFLDAEVRLFGKPARFRCLGGIDFDRIACIDFEQLTGTPSWCMDMEALYNFGAPWMLRAMFGERAPDCVFLSPPCKGSSRLLSSAKAKTEKYQKMNRLAVLWIEMMLEAWKSAPPPLVLLENVPGLPQRAKPMLRELRALLRDAGYIFHASTHDCGELGGLAQHRKRYLLVARHPGRCPPLLYQPTKKRVRGIGEVLSALPMPATPAAAAWGELHTMPRLSWRNWKRLALIPAGGDWRDLEGVLEGRARREVFRRHALADWKEPIDAVTGPGGHSVEGVNDPRIQWHPGAYGVKPWEEPAATITGGADGVSRGRFAVSDPRLAGAPPGAFHNVDRVLSFDESAPTVTSGRAPSSGRPAVADPRLTLPPNDVRHRNKYAVRDWKDPAGTVIGKTQPGSGLPAIADLRVSTAYDHGYGVIGWEDASPTVAGTVAAGTGAYAVSDPREGGFVDGVRVFSLDEAMELDLDPGKPPPFIPIIVAEDGTWHRPLTLLELAALQDMPMHVNGAPLHLHGTRTQIAEHIGNAVPRATARAIAERMLVALSEGVEGSFSLSGDGPVWIAPQTLSLR